MMLTSRELNGRAAKILNVNWDILLYTDPILAILSLHNFFSKSFFAATGCNHGKQIYANTGGGVMSATKVAIANLWINHEYALGPTPGVLGNVQA